MASRLHAVLERTQEAMLDAARKTYIDPICDEEDAVNPV